MNTGATLRIIIPCSRFQEVPHSMWILWGVKMALVKVLLQVLQFFTVIIIIIIIIISAVLHTDIFHVLYTDSITR
jgi:hypothetical protein